MKLPGFAAVNNQFHIARMCVRKKSVQLPAKALVIATAIFSLLPVTSAVASVEDTEYDIVIYGGTSAAVTTAVQARQMGKTTIIVSPDIHIGGLTSGGLGWTDSGNKNAIGGLSRNFYHRVWQHYQKADSWTWQDQAKFGNRNQSGPGPAGDGSTMWVFEPHVAEAIFDEMLAEYSIPVLRGEWLDRSPTTVTQNNGRITSIKTVSGKTILGKMFVDTTYEGDLLATANIDYHVGREANSVYGETWNGIQVGILHHKHWFQTEVDPYVKPGDPSSGVLPGISTRDPGVRGDGDHRIQAYCFRMCLTNVPENKIPFPKPEGYDPGKYELLLRVFDGGWREMFAKFDPMPNHKTDTNNHGPFSTDNIGMNYDYPEATYKRRSEIIQEHKVYQQGLMYFMANDKRVPEDVRAAMSKWGLPKDEFLDNGGWPHQIYVREARRMIGEYVMTEHDCLDTRETPDSIGMGSYTLDSHNVQRYITPDGLVQNEGDIGVHAPRAYEIAYGSIVPKKSQCENLLVPVCVSSSHIAFGSIRMEPVFMILGQSAATAACLALDNNLAVQDVPYDVLRKRLLEDKQVLEMEDSSLLSSRKLKGTVIDDRAAEFEGDWQSSTANKPFVDSGYSHNGNSEQGKKSATFHTKLPAGNYRVLMSYPANGNRATNIPVTVYHAEGHQQVIVNERIQPPIDKTFIELGTFEFSGEGKVVIETTDTNGHVVVDAIQFLPVE